MGSEMLESGSSGSIVKVGGEGRGGNDGGRRRRSGVGNEAGERGWDWRAGWRRDANGGEILKALRMGLARAMAGGWVAGEC